MRRTDFQPIKEQELIVYQAIVIQKAGFVQM